MLQSPPPVDPEDTLAMVFLMDLLDLAKADSSLAGRLTVRWGDGSPPENFELGHGAVNGDHTHSFAEDGYYDTVLTLTRCPGRIELWRFTLQVSNLAGEITYFRPMDAA